MMMTTTLADVLDDFSPEDRADIERDAAVLIAESRTLAEMRRGLGLSQTALADALRTSQANVAKIESGRSDIMVSTIARVVEAMGGTMRMVVELPGRPATLLKVEQAGGKTRLARSKRSASSAQKNSDLAKALGLGKPTLKRAVKPRRKAEATLRPVHA